MLETVVVVLLILWLLGMFGPVALPALSINHHGLLHVLLVVVVVLVIARLIGRL